MEYVVVDQDNTLLHGVLVIVAIIHAILVVPIEYARVVMLQLTSVNLKDQTAFQWLDIMKVIQELLPHVELVVQDAINGLTVNNVN